MNTIQYRDQRCDTLSAACNGGFVITVDILTVINCANFLYRARWYLIAQIPSLQKL